MKEITGTEIDSSEMLDLIGRFTREVIPDLAAHTFQREDRLSDLGANSVDRAEIITLVLDALSLKTPRVELFGPTNIGELADLLHGKLCNK